MGPLTVPSGVNKVAEQVEDATKQGGKILTAGKRDEGEGYFYEPTVISNSTKGVLMRLRGQPKSKLNSQSAASLCNNRSCQFYGCYYRSPSSH